MGGPGGMMGGGGGRPGGGMGGPGGGMIGGNRPGGNMVIALDACARSTPDGYTMCLMNSSGMSVNPHVMLKLPYDPERDFKPISNMYFLLGEIGRAHV